MLVGGGEDGEGEDGDEADRERDEQAGDVLEAEEWASEEGVRALGPLRRRGRRHRLLSPWKALRVLQHQLVNARYTTEKWIFSGTLFSMEKTIDRYRRHAKSGINNNEVTQQWKFEAASMSRKIESLEVSKRKLLGENLESCSAEELHEIEGKIEQSLCHVRGKKNQLLEEQIATLKEQEQTLMEENALLREKCKLQSQLRPAAAPEETVPCSQDGENMEVETELYIGWPGRGRTNCRSQG
uniref:MADS-box transcription factor 50-like isoform X2 n=1 Tax=Elaeis guineensis var. tenera TaxID=51953 RepID=A0A6I9RYL8_ELAGV|nr:MADS-box transcription factor 50-like isoform X2 [Elaeis guineensis]